jgi:hypothetical protein
MVKSKSVKASVNFIGERIEARIPLKNEKDVVYIGERLVWLVDKYKMELFENASKLVTEAILKEAFDVLKQLDVKINDFDELMTGIAMTIAFAIKNFEGKLKVAETFFANEFLRMMHLRCIIETTCMMQHINHFSVTLKNAGVGVSEISKIIEKSMECAETKVTYDGNNDSYLDDCVQEMVRLCQALGKPISQNRLMPPIKNKKAK